MKTKGAAISVLLKQMISVVRCLQAKAKCTAIKSKTDAVKTQLMVTTLTVMSKINKKKYFSLRAISRKFNQAIDGIFNHHLMSADGSSSSDNRTPRKGQQQHQCAIALCNSESAVTCSHHDEADVHDYVEDDDDDKYPDLRHLLFDEEEEKELVELMHDEDPAADSLISVIDQVKHSKEDGGERFNLEDEIDEVADLFITKFHKRMRLQKLLSFKRYQDMMETSRS